MADIKAHKADRAEYLDMICAADDRVMSPEEIERYIAALHRGQGILPDEVLWTAQNISPSAIQTETQREWILQDLLVFGHDHALVAIQVLAAKFGVVRSFQNLRENYERLELKHRFSKAGEPSYTHMLEAQLAILADAVKLAAERRAARILPGPTP